jgi:hypothetical protein
MEIKARHQALTQRFEELERFFQDYERRFKRRLVSQERQPARLLGHNAARLLLSSLSRARSLTAAIIHCANGGMASGMYLATRAHWEMTGLVTHLLSALRKLYSNEMTDEEFEPLMLRLAMGRRWEIPEQLQQDVLAINAVTLIGTAARFFGAELEQVRVEEHVRSCYEFLSEFCHPNLMARQVGVTLSDYGRVTEYERELTVTELDLRTCFSHGLSSHALFLHAYDQCFRLLEEHEEMPALET